jgi:hypothetical protein
MIGRYDYSENGAHTDGVTQLAFTLDGKFLVSGGCDQNVCMRTLPLLELVWEKGDHQHTISYLQIIPNFVFSIDISGLLIKSSLLNAAIVYMK